MKLKILEETDKKIKVEIEEEGHSFSNALRKELWNDSHVKVAGYNIRHGLIKNPVLIVETDGKEKPRIALKKAADGLRKKMKDLKTVFKKL